MTQPALSVRGLRVALRNRAADAPLIRDIDIDLAPGSITGLAGESGCGKSLTGLALLGLNDTRLFESRCTSATLNGEPLPLTEPAAMRPFRGSGLAMIFQDPSSALDPVFTVGSQIRRAISRLRGVNRQAASKRALGVLSDVGFPDPQVIARRYPHELSGGMRQLCLIAMAHALRPQVLIADEPTTALDATSQAIVLEQLTRLARVSDTAVLMITHDLRLLTRHADSLLVMYQGRIVEQTTGRRLFEHAVHPYSAGLLAATPRLHGQVTDRAKGIPGQLPRPTEQLRGCAFAPRCPQSTERCTQRQPELTDTTESASGTAACFNPLIKPLTPVTS